jgi:hypothetical protein
MDKKLVGLGMIVGSTLGGYVPTWFGVSAFSYISILGGFFGGILGIWLAVRFLE